MGVSDRIRVGASASSVSVSVLVFVQIANRVNQEVEDCTLL